MTPQPSPQYRVVALSPSDGDASAYLNDMALHGWRVIAACGDKTHGRTVILEAVPAVPEPAR
jgi:hypothetical protein